MNEKIKLRPAIQKYHPDSPSTGWTVDVLNVTTELLVARMYGMSKEAAQRRAAAFMLAMGQALPKDYFKSTEPSP